jgi:hypothetical protein
VLRVSNDRPEEVSALELGENYSKVAVGEAAVAENLMKNLTAWWPSPLANTQPYDAQPLPGNMLRQARRS